MNTEVAVSIILAVMGAGLGSFACCQAWRIRKKDKSPRSHCMNCRYQLQWFDNIPIISWLFLRGKCRRCHKKIGFMELLAEVALAVAFVLSYLLWPWREKLLAGDAFEVAKFIVFLVELVVFMILFVYDAKWKEMPTKILIAAVVVGLVWTNIEFTRIILLEGFSWKMFMELAGALIILPGFYYFMYRASKEKWVGSGDAILCLPLAMMLGKFWLAMFCLFGSNMIGSLIMMPVVAAKKEKHAMIPFGPFLIIGFLAVFFLQHAIINFITI